MRESHKSTIKLSDMLVNFEAASIFQDNEHLVLSNVDFSLQAGEFVYLVGKVGSGKSSLIKTMNAELPFQQGTASVLGFNLEGISKADIPQLRRRIGVVFQDFQLLSDRTVFKNFEFVLKATGWKGKAEIAQRVAEVLELVEMPNCEQKMPHELSGGEQQRVVIARALLNDPELILADEPTGNLDEESSARITEILHKLSTSGKAVIMATHDTNQVEKYPATVIRCEAGKLHY